VPPRSKPTPAIMIRQPPFFSPSISLFGTMTLSKKTSEMSYWRIMFGMGRTVTPGVFISRRKQEMPR
jgi:hypothetical protein